MKKLTLPVESVRERDIDFLLVEELLSSPTFIDYLLSGLGLPDCHQLVSVERSISDFDLGETDILAEYTSGESRIGLLIENKLDASFQPEQASRYQSRAELYLQSSKFDSTYSLLIAPAHYIENQNDFELTISYEQLIDYFQQPELEKRGEFKSTLLKIAIEKLRRGYTAINSTVNQAFWMSYAKYIQQRLPAVMMKPVDVVPAGSDWIELSFGEHKFIHKLQKGQLDFLNLPNEIAKRLEDEFPAKTTQLTFESGPVLRIQTEPLDRMNSFVDQISKVNQAVDQINRAVNIIDGQSQR